MHHLAKPALLRALPLSVSLSLSLMLSLSPMAAFAQGALQGSWHINGNGHTGVLTLQQSAAGNLFGSMYNEPVRGFMAEDEGVAVLLRGPYEAPTQAFVGRFRKAFSKGGISMPATWSGEFYALTPGMGASSQNNRFAFTAVPASEPYPGWLPALPPPASAEGCLQLGYTFVNRPQEYGNTWTVPLQFNWPVNACATGMITGRLSGDFIQGHYAPGAGTVVFARSLSGVSRMPSQLYVGQASGGELVVQQLRGRFYALDSYGGASRQRMSYDWTAN
jgi:hypothetical protein